MNELLETLQYVDFRLKSDILESLAELLSGLNAHSKAALCQAIYNILQGNELDSSASKGGEADYTGKSSKTDRRVERLSFDRVEDQHFVQQSLIVLQSLGESRRDFYVEIMMAYIEGSDSMRSAMLNLLGKCGVRDANGLFAKELETWDLCCHSCDRQKQLREHCGEFLDKWQICFTNHLRDMVSKLKRGEAIEGRLMPGSKHKTEKSSQQTVQVTLDGTDKLTADDVTYVEAINYFCEMALNKQLLQRQLSNSLWPVSDGKKNTIISLPQIVDKQNLVRLGDSHTSKCRSAGPHNAYIKQTADVLGSVITTINLPLKRVIVNPFPCYLDQFDPLYSDTHVLLVLKTGPKYFIPANSYLPSSC